MEPSPMSEVCPMCHGKGIITVTGGRRTTCLGCGGTGSHDSFIEQMRAAAGPQHTHEDLLGSRDSFIEREKAEEEKKRIRQARSASGCPVYGGEGIVYYGAGGGGLSHDTWFSKTCSGCGGTGSRHSYIEREKARDAEYARQALRRWLAIVCVGTLVLGIAMWYLFWR